MSETKLRAAVIGGGLGGSHGYAYARAQEYELVAVCDINPEVFDRFYGRAEIARGGIGEYADYREMFAKENLDVVSVATPDHLHVDPVCDASDAGIRGILCEKPLATTLADADCIVETIERNGTHLVDAVCFFADAEPVWVIAAHERGFEDYGPVYDGKGGKDPQYDPGSTIIVEFRNGVRGIINAAKLTPQMFEFDLQGPGGRYWLTDQQCTFWKTEQPEGRAELMNASEGRGYADPFGENLIPAVQELARMISDDVPSSSPAERGRHTLEIMVAALESQVEDSAKIQLPLPRH